MSTEVFEKNEEKFYSDAANYWSEIPATVDGMLGGFGFVSQTDIKDSKMLLKQLFNANNPPDRQYALDCGAGIGRITKFLLTDLFDKVDLVEQNPIFLEQSKRYMGHKISKIGNFYPEGLQYFRPQSKRYDVIWIQWVLGHLTDTDLINFLISCQDGLRSNGVIIIKENITSTGDIELDRQDSSVTRPMWLFRRIFNKANLECYRLVKQRNFPKGLYSVFMFVLKPKNVEAEITSNKEEVKSETEKSEAEIVERPVIEVCETKEDIKPVSIENDSERQDEESEISEGDKKKFEEQNIS